MILLIEFLPQRGTKGTTKVNKGLIMCDLKKSKNLILLYLSVSLCALRVPLCLKVLFFD